MHWLIVFHWCDDFSWSTFEIPFEYLKVQLVKLSTNFAVLVINWKWINQQKGMKNIIWFNKINSRFNCGTPEKFELMQRFYGEKVVMKEQFENVSLEIINKVTKSLNRQYKNQTVLVEI